MSYLNLKLPLQPLKSVIIVRLEYNLCSTFLHKSFISKQHNGLIMGLIEFLEERSPAADHCGNG